MEPTPEESSRSPPLFDHGVDLTRWDNPRALREAFRTEGFGVIEVHGSVASELCEGAFSPEQFLHESDRRAVFWMKTHLTPRDRTLLPYPDELDRRVSEAVQGRSHRQHAARHLAKIEQQKIEEAHQVLPKIELASLAKKDIGMYLDLVCDLNGFQRSRSRFRPYKYLYWKPVEGTNLIGFFGWDRGGRFDSYQRGMPPSIPSLETYLQAGGMDEHGMGVPLVHLASSMGQYLHSAGAIHFTDRQNFERIPDEFWFPIIQVGIVAQVRFFDLFLNSVSEHVLRLNE